MGHCDKQPSEVEQRTRESEMNDVITAASTLVCVLYDSSHILMIIKTYMMLSMPWRRSLSRSSSLEVESPSIGELKHGGLVLATSTCACYFLTNLCQDLGHLASREADCYSF